MLKAPLGRKRYLLEVVRSQLLGPPRHRVDKETDHQHTHEPETGAPSAHNVSYRDSNLRISSRAPSCVAFSSDPRSSISGSSNSISARCLSSSRTDRKSTRL